MFYAPATHVRRPRDHYATPPELVRGLLIGLAEARLELPTPVHDPCAGAGRLIDELALHGIEAAGSDLHPGEYPPHPKIAGRPIDATNRLLLTLAGARSLVTNPPYGRQAEKIVQTGAGLALDGQVAMAAFLLPLPWEAAGRASRVALMRSCALRVVCCWRPEWIDGTGGGGKMSSCWFVWTTKRASPFPQTVHVAKP